MLRKSNNCKDVVAGGKREGATVPGPASMHSTDRETHNAVSPLLATGEYTVFSGWRLSLTVPVVQQGAEKHTTQLVNYWQPPILRYGGGRSDALVCDGETHYAGWSTTGTGQYCVSRGGGPVSASGQWYAQPYKHTSRVVNYWHQFILRFWLCGGSLCACHEGKHTTRSGSTTAPVNTAFS